MFAIYIKTFIALLLGIAPFAFTWFYRSAKGNPDSKSKSLFAVIGRHLPLLRKMTAAIGRWCRRLYDGMRREDSFRKFFTLIILFLMIVIQYVDFSASTTVARIVQSTVDFSGDSSGVLTAGIKPLFPFLTRPHATVIAALLSWSFFYYRIADRLLSWLHANDWWFGTAGLLTAVMIIVYPRLFIIPELTAIILMAAAVYPDKLVDDTPKGKKPIPVHPRRSTLKAAA